MHSGRGTAYTLPAGERRPRVGSGYSTEDPYRPITRGTYRLTWRGDVAELALWGEGLVYTPVPLTCR